MNQLERAVLGTRDREFDEGLRQLMLTMYNHTVEAAVAPVEIRVLHVVMVHMEVVVLVDGIAVIIVVFSHFKSCFVFVREGLE